MKDSDATNTHGKEEVKPMSMNMQSWHDGLNACKTIEQLQALYKQKESIIIANKEVLALFTAKKLSLTQNN
jgi:hypothetical protein